jgi:hypothetical protein
MECQYCYKKLSSISALNLHQKTTKYCLKIQLELKTEVIEAENKAVKNEIIYENDILKTKITNLETEIASLKLKIIAFEDIEKKYNVLLDKVTKSALEPKIVNNKVVNNNNNIRIFSRTDDEIDEIYNKYMTISHIIGGVDSMAQLTVDKIIKDTDGNAMITITDKARQNAIYKAPTGEIVKDFGLKSFTDRAKKSINKRMYPLIGETDNKELDSSIVFKGINDITDDTSNEKLARKIVKYI